MHQSEQHRQPAHRPGPPSTAPSRTPSSTTSPTTASFTLSSGERRTTAHHPKTPKTASTATMIKAEETEAAGCRQLHPCRRGRIGPLFLWGHAEVVQQRRRSARGGSRCIHSPESGSGRVDQRIGERSVQLLGRQRHRADGGAATGRPVDARRRRRQNEHDHDRGGLCTSRTMRAAPRRR